MVPIAHYLLHCLKAQPLGEFAIFLHGICASRLPFSPANTLRTSEALGMPGFARTLAQKAKKLEKGAGHLTTKFFFHLPSCLFAGAHPAGPLASKKRKIEKSGPNETPSDEGGPRSTPTSILSMLPLDATPFDSLLEDYRN
jgi:hypothetical protein